MTNRPAPKTALVTGAASGIGRAYARILASRKIQTVLVDIQSDKLADVAEEIKKGLDGVKELYWDFSELGVHDFRRDR